MSAMNEVKVLTGAKSLLVRHGWITGQFGDPQRGFCTVGAVRWSASGMTGATADSESVLDLLATLIRRRDHISDLSVARSPADVVASWNDTNGRTLDHVIALIDEALFELAPPPPPAPVLVGWADSTEIPRHTITQRVRQLVGI